MTAQDGFGLLLVEDAPALAGMLTRALSAEGHDVSSAPDGQSGLHLALTRHFDVIMVDRGLPAIEGLDLIG